SAAETDDGDRERDGRQEDQTLGHHRDRPGDGTRERLAAIALLAELADEQQRRGRNDRDRDVEQDPVDPAAELGPRQGESTSLLDQLRGIRVAADARGAVAA